MRHMLLIPIAGDMTLVEAPDLDSMRDTIRCSYVERVRVGIDWALAVDEDGCYTTKVMNPRASVLYGTQFHGAPIIGDVLLGREGIVGGTDPGVDWVDITTDEALEFMASVTSRQNKMAR